MTTLVNYKKLIIQLDPIKKQKFEKHCNSNSFKLIYLYKIFLR